jgi:hypothetical protein
MFVILGCQLRPSPVSGSGKTPMGLNATIIGPFGNLVVGNSIPFDDYTAVSVLGTSKISTISVRSSSTGITGLQVTYSYPDNNPYGNSTVTHGSTSGTLQTKDWHPRTCISYVAGVYNESTATIQTLFFYDMYSDRTFVGGLVPINSSDWGETFSASWTCLVAINGRKTANSITQLSFVWEGPNGESYVGVVGPRLDGFGCLPAN